MAVPSRRPKRYRDPQVETKTADMGGMTKTLKLITSGFGLIVTLAIVAAFAFITAPQTEASIQLPAPPATTTTTAAPEIATPATIMQKVSKAKAKAGRPTTTSVPSTTLATIPREVIDRIDTGSRWNPEVAGMGEQPATSTTDFDTPDEEQQQINVE